MSTWFSKSFGAATLATALTLSCSGGEPVTVNERMFLREGQDLVAKGAGCMSMKLPSSGGGSSSSSGSNDGDISLTEGPEGDVFVVRIFSGSTLVASRSYSAVWLDSGQMDEFDVTTRSGAIYLLRYWGGACADLDASTP